MADERGNDEGNDEAEDGGERRENEAFDEELANEAQARCTERATKRGFVTAGDGASELQVGDIGAGDKQDRGDAGEKDEERLAIVAGDVALQGLNVYLATGEK